MYQKQEAKDMNTETRYQFIGELTAKINEYVEEDDLFAGGCCYAAYLLAKALQTAGIKYLTTIFQYNEILNATNFNDAINGRGVSHVAIEVRMGNKPTPIGSCAGIYQFFRDTEFDYNVRKYQNVTPGELLSGYINGNWNKLYNTNMNKHLAREIAEITMKYTGKSVRMTVPAIL